MPGGEGNCWVLKVKFPMRPATYCKNYLNWKASSGLSVRTGVDLGTMGPALAGSGRGGHFLLCAAFHGSSNRHHENQPPFLLRGHNFSIFWQLYRQWQRKSPSCCLADFLHGGQHCTRYAKTSFHSTLLNIKLLLSGCSV